MIRNGFQCKHALHVSSEDFCSILIIHSYQDHHSKRDEFVGNGAVDELEVVEKTSVVLTTVDCLDVPTSPACTVDLVHA